MNNSRIRNHVVSCIVRERKRQRTFEGFDYANDDANVNGELARAAACYALCAAGTPDARDVARKFARIGAAPRTWPTGWTPAFWKPSPDDRPQDRLRELEKAGALIVAEMERLHRLIRDEHRVGSEMLDRVMTRKRGEEEA